MSIVEAKASQYSGKKKNTLNYVEDEKCQKQHEYFH